MFGWFKSKWKWVGTIECSWYDHYEGEERTIAHSTYNLYVHKNGKRKCKAFGYTPYAHSFYSRGIKPWVNGGGNLLLQKHLAVYSTSYWGDLSKKKDKEKKPTRLELML